MLYPSLINFSGAPVVRNNVWKFAHNSYVTCLSCVLIATRTVCYFVISYLNVILSRNYEAPYSKPLIIFRRCKLTAPPNDLSGLFLDSGRIFTRIRRSRPLGQSVNPTAQNAERFAATAIGDCRNVFIMLLNRT